MRADARSLVLVLRVSSHAASRRLFTPPCALAVARGRDPAPVLGRPSERRLRMKVRVAPLVAAAGVGEALYTLALEQLAGPANRAAFGSLARSLPLAAPRSA